MNDLFLRACRGERTEKTPVWFMRQAGRSLPGYRKLRERYGVLELTQTPELAAQVSLEPVTLLGVDAAILFADIMLLPIAMGIDVKIVESVGPVIDNPIVNPEDVSRLQVFDASRIEFLQQTIKILRGELKIPLIGFAGAPFTIASYLIEGKPTRDWHKTKRFMREHPEAWMQLMDTLAVATVGYLRAQVEAGAQALQLFDSWVGCLSPSDYRAYVLPHVQKIFNGLTDLAVPRIHFGTHTAGLLTDFANVECEVVGVDWRISLAEAKNIVGAKSLQGNLDPTVLLAPWTAVQTEVDRIMSEIDPKQGYIFNLGHGVLPQTDDTQIKKLVDYVHTK